MTGSEIIAKFELFVDDGTELSTQEELDLANKIQNQICNYRPWEFLKKTASGTMSSYEIPVPADFAYLANNYQSTDDSVSTQSETSPKVIFIGTNLDPYRIINFSDRRQYRNQNVAYIDPEDSTIKFVTTPSSTTYEFDYISTPTSISSATGPAFPSRFHDIIYLGMAVDDYAIQQFDKAKSYAQENQAKYNSYLNDMSFWNAQSTLN